MMVFVKAGQKLERDKFLKMLIDIHYNRNDFDFGRGTFRVRGDVVEVHLAYEEVAVRVEFFGDEIEKISVIDILRGEVLEEKAKASIYPAKHFVTTMPKIER